MDGDGQSLFGDDGIVVTFDDGHSEMLRNKRFMRFDRGGQLIVDRRASGTDRDRLRAIETAVRNRQDQDVTTLIVIDAGLSEIRIMDARGWVEVLSRDHYRLSDPDGNTVADRRPRSRDMARIRGMIGG